MVQPLLLKVVTALEAQPSLVELLPSKADQQLVVLVQGPAEQ